MAFILNLVRREHGAAISVSRSCGACWEKDMVPPSLCHGKETRSSTNTRLRMARRPTDGCRRSRLRDSIGRPSSWLLVVKGGKRKKRANRYVEPSRGATRAETGARVRASTRLVGYEKVPARRFDEALIPRPGCDHGRWAEPARLPSTPERTRPSAHRQVRAVQHLELARPRPPFPSILRLFTRRSFNPEKLTSAGRRWVVTKIAEYLVFIMRERK